MDTKVRDAVCDDLISFARYLLNDLDISLDGDCGIDREHQQSYLATRADEFVGHCQARDQALSSLWP